MIELEKAKAFVRNGYFSCLNGWIKLSVSFLLKDIEIGYYTSEEASIIRDIIDNRKHIPLDDNKDFCNALQLLARNRIIAKNIDGEYVFDNRVKQQEVLDL